MALGLVLAPPPPPDRYKKLWTAIWNAKVPNKVALQVRKSCENILANRQCLSTKGYIGDSMCPFCARSVETNTHLFNHCGYATEIWTAAGLPLPQMGTMEIKEWLLESIDRVSKDQFCKILLIIWAIWKNRNTQVWDGVKQHPCDVVLMAIGWWEDFKKANSSPPQQMLQRHGWQEPPVGWIKCNIDGAFVSQTGRGGAGLIFREHGGQFRAMAIKPLQTIISPFHAEFTALSEGIKMAEGMGYNQVIFETDFLILAAAINQIESDLSMFSHVIEDLKTQVQRHANFKVVFVPREANRIAHSIASMALNTNVGQTRFGTAPEFIRDAILNECTR